MTISIHTPVKGVTGALSAIRAKVRISIHTPVKGVTGRDIDNPRDAIFQSTHP